MRLLWVPGRRGGGVHVSAGIHGGNSTGSHPTKMQVFEAHPKVSRWVKAKPWHHHGCKQEFFRGFWEKPVGFFFQSFLSQNICCKTFAPYLEVACPLIESVGTSKKNQDLCFVRACWNGVFTPRKLGGWWMMKKNSRKGLQWQCNVWRLSWTDHDELCFFRFCVVMMDTIMLTRPVSATGQIIPKATPQDIV